MQLCANFGRKPLKFIIAEASLEPDGDIRERLDGYHEISGGLPEGCGSDRDLSAVALQRFRGRVPWPVRSLNT